MRLHCTTGLPSCAYARPAILLPQIKRLAMLEAERRLHEERQARREAKQAEKDELAATETVAAADGDAPTSRPPSAARLASLQRPPSPQRPTSRPPSATALRNLVEIRRLAEKKAEGDDPGKGAGKAPGKGGGKPGTPKPGQGPLNTSKGQFSFTMVADGCYIEHKWGQNSGHVGVPLEAIPAFIQRLQTMYTKTTGVAPAAKKSPAASGIKVKGITKGGKAAKVAKKKEKPKKKMELAPKKSLEELDAELTSYTAARTAGDGDAMGDAAA